MTTLLPDAPAIAGRTASASDAMPVQHSSAASPSASARRAPRRRPALAAGLLMALPMLANAASVSYTGYDVQSGQGIPLYIVLAPEGQSASSFLSSSEGSRWKNVVDVEDAKLVVMDGGGTTTTWNSSDDVTSLASLYASQTSSGIEGASRYMAAYGTAGTTLAAYAVQYPNNLAGVAFINAASTTSISGISGKPQRPLAVLTVDGSTPSSSLDSFVSHFRTENARGGTEGSSTSNADDLRYYRTGSSPWNRDFTSSHFVRRMRNVVTTDMPSLVHANLFSKVSRWRTVQGNYTLRARVRAGSTGFFRITETVGGSSRDAYVYVPASVRSNPDVPTPVVMLFHGVTGNGNYFIDQTEFNRVADEYGFIVYAPTASGFSWSSSNFARYRTLISGFGTNGITANGVNHAVDARRIYMHGFSNGSYFVSDFVAGNGDLLAAAGSWAYSQASSVSGQAIPYWYGVGSLDGADCPNTFVNAMRGVLGTNSTSTVYYAALDSANRVATTVYRNTGNGLEARCSIATNVEHGNLNEHSRNLWKDFFAKYRRKSDGSGSELIPTGGGGTQAYANTTAQDLPALATIFSDIAVTGRTGNAPSNATLSVNISHTYRGDVVIDLIAPDGSVYPVKAASGSDSADDVIQSYQLNLSSEPLNGAWRLRVSDVDPADSGRLNNWSLSF